MNESSTPSVDQSTADRASARLATRPERRYPPPRPAYGGCRRFATPQRVVLLLAGVGILGFMAIIFVVLALISARL